MNVDGLGLEVELTPDVFDQWENCTLERCQAEHSYRLPDWIPPTECNGWPSRIVPAGHWQLELCEGRVQQEAQRVHRATADPDPKIVAVMRWPKTENESYERAYACALMWDSGMSLKDVAALFGVAHSTVVWAIARFNLGYPNGYKHQARFNPVPVFRELSRAKNFSDLARRAGCSVEHIMDLLAYMNITDDHLAQMKDAGW